MPAKTNKTKSQPWTLQETKILRELYPTIGPTEIAQQIPGRNYKAICAKAAVLGLKFTSKAQKPTPVEEVPQPVAAPIETAPPAELSQRIHVLTARNKPGLVRVPDSVLGMPWVRYPRIPAELREAADLIDAVASKTVEGTIKCFLISEAAHLRARAEREANKTPETMPTLNYVQGRKSALIAS